LSAAGNDIVNSLRQIVDFKEDYSIEVEISATEEGITEDQRKQANAIIEALSNYKGRNKVDIEVEFVFNGNADEIKLVVEM
jgi:phenylacetate-coenzyme A ligase PaaK-like adenylate-forming protein